MGKWYTILIALLIGWSNLPGIHCVRGRIDYSGLQPYVEFQSWPAWEAPYDKRWQLIGWQIGPNISWQTPLNFSNWTPRPITSTSGIWGAVVAWTSDADLQVRKDYPETCRVRSYLPLGELHGRT